jgi:CheY-like chemotaxis protein
VTTDCVADGPAAAEMLREHSYSVVLVDLSLSDVAAERILGSVRAVSVADRPIVLVLAAANMARSLDVDLIQIVLRKPCNIAQVADLVQSCVHANRLSTGN